jgi:hypothetical protein
MHYSYIRFINLLTHDESPENESLTKYRKRANSDDANGTMMETLQNSGHLTGSLWLSGHKIYSGYY